jgi:flagellar basal body-associated protein FliL
MRASSTDAAGIDTVLSGVRNGGLVGGVPASSATTTTGTSVAAPSSSSSDLTIIIIIAVCGAVLLVICIIIVALLVARRRRTSGGSKGGYNQLEDQSLHAADYVAFEPVGGTKKSSQSRSSYAAPLTAAPAKPSNMITVKFTHNVEKTEETILAARAGEIGLIEKEDWETRGDWVWCTIGANQGYVPVGFCAVQVPK